MRPSVVYFKALTADSEDSPPIFPATAGSISGGPVRTGIFQASNSGSAITGLLIKGRINSDFPWLTIATLNVAGQSVGINGGFSANQVLTLYPEMMITNGSGITSGSVLVGIVT